MTIPVKLRRSGTTTATPSSLEYGELAINYADGVVFYRDSSDVIQSFTLQAYALSSHTHAASDITSGTLDAARLPLATTGAVGGVIVGTGLGVSSGTVSVTYGTNSTSSCRGDDSRLSDARTPTAHKTSHATGGSDALTPSDIGAAPLASPTFTGTVTVPGLTATAAILADDLSSANSVVYSFDGDPNTGVGRGGADILTLVTNGSERMRIDASGVVSITSSLTGGQLVLRDNTTNSTNKFGFVSTTHYDTSEQPAACVGVSSQSAGTVVYVGGGVSLLNAATLILFYTASDNTTVVGTERMRVTSTGEVLIGTTADNGAYKLQVDSQIYATNATIATSDARFKTNVESLTDATAVIEAMRPVAFDFIPHEERNFATERQVGLIAQEAQSALAGTDYADSVVAQCGDHLGLAYEKLVPVLIKALQESNARIAALEERLNHA